MINTRYSLRECPDALSVKVRIKAGQGRGGGGDDFGLIGGTRSPHNDAAPATRKDTKWRPSWPQTSVSQEAGGGGENGSGSIRPTSYLHLQLRAPSPRVISTKITAATLKYGGGGVCCVDQHGDGHTPREHPVSYPQTFFLFPQITWLHIACMRRGEQK